LYNTAFAEKQFPMTKWRKSRISSKTEVNGRGFRRLCAEALELRALLTVPTASDDYQEMLQDSSLVIEPAGLLANDSDADGDVLQVALVLADGPSAGTLTVRSGGDLLYKPNHGFYGEDSFRYYAADGSNFSGEPATVIVRVKDKTPPSTGGVIIHNPDFDPTRVVCVGAPPVGTSAPKAVKDCGFITAEDMPLVVDAPGVLANDYSGDGSPLVATLESGPEHGTVAVNDDGSFTYVPSQDYFGADQFVYRLTNDSEFFDLGTVSLEITSVNDAPVPHDDTFTTEAGLLLRISVGELLANDRDVEHDPLTAVMPLGRAPRHGTLALTGNGLLYTPDLGYQGTDEFAYAETDGQLFSAGAATVSISLTAPFRHNTRLGLDVDNDFHVTAGDALAVINCLNGFGAGSVSRAANYVRDLVDVDGDGMVTANDALTVINVINAGGHEGEGEAGWDGGVECSTGSQIFIASEPETLDLFTMLATDTAQAAKRRRFES